MDFSLSSGAWAALLFGIAVVAVVVTLFWLFDMYKDKNDKCVVKLTRCRGRDLAKYQ